MKLISPFFLNAERLFEIKIKTSVKTELKLNEIENRKLKKERERYKTKLL